MKSLSFFLVAFGLFCAVTSQGGETETEIEEGEGGPCHHLRGKRASPVQCLVPCEFGERLDEDGCPIPCDCNPNPCNLLEEPCVPGTVCQVFRRDCTGGTCIHLNPPVARCIPPVAGACLLPPAPGPCRMSLPRYFFNAFTGSCEQFTYGGCRGNANRFSSLQECEASRCGSPAPVTPAPPATTPRGKYGTSRCAKPGPAAPTPHATSQCCPGNQIPGTCCSLPSCLPRCGQTPPFACPFICSTCCCPPGATRLAADGVTCITDSECPPDNVIGL